MIGQPPRAGAFIVTFFGDVVAPRGGSVWTGDIVAVCADAGISETLARTALSRLTAAGMLEGQRDGRRSFYALTARARAEFAVAGKRLFAPLAARGDWILAAGEAREGFVRLASGVLLGLDDGVDTGVILRGTAGVDLPPLVARLWDLDGVATGWREFLEFLARSDPPDTGAGALRARLMLMHRWRHLRLAAPDLPMEVLPEDWPGLPARAGFARAYTALSPLAEAHVAATMVSPRGLLPAQTAQTRARLVVLSQDITEYPEYFVDM